MQYKGENETFLEVAEAATELREVLKNSFSSPIIFIPLFLS
jgi:hypothetical protein